MALIIEDPDADLVTLEQLAATFDIHRTGVRRWLVKEGFQLRFIRLPESGNQLCAALNRQEAQAAIALRRKLGFRVKA
ncbi:MAG: hypothetical protein WB586_00100 [Chthoniobacterales bacterium]